MSKADVIFKKNARFILEHGTSTEGQEVRPKWPDGNPAYTLKQFGSVEEYDLRDEFPAITVRKTGLKSAMDEILWIYQKKCNNVNELGSHIWDEWADKTGSIGKAYGYQAGKDYTGKLYSKAKNLMRQILSPEDAPLFSSAKNDDEAREVLNNVIKNVPSSAYLNLIIEFSRKLKSDFCVKGNNLHEISHIVTGDHQTISDAVISYEIEKLNAMKPGLKNAEIKKIDKQISSVVNLVNASLYSFEDIDGLCGCDVMQGYITALREKYADIQNALTQLVSTNILENGTIYGNKSVITILKDYFDSCTGFRRLVKLIELGDGADENKSTSVDVRNLTDDFLDLALMMNKGYKIIKSYITSSVKDRSVRVQTGFGGSSMFEASWISSNAIDNGKTSFTAIIRDIDGKYYFIAKSPVGNSFKYKTAVDGEPFYEMLVQDKINLKQSLANFVFSRNTKAAFEDGADSVTIPVSSVMAKEVVIPRCAYEAYIARKNKTPIGDAGETVKAEQSILKAYIDYINSSNTLKTYNIKVKAYNEYSSVNEFFDSLEACLSTRFERMSREHIDLLAESGDILMFLISHRDLYKGRIEAGKKVDSTVRIFTELFSDRNMKEHFLQLNSRPSVFFRPAAIKSPVVLFLMP